MALRQVPLKGADGRTPEFRLNGSTLEYRLIGDAAWQSLGSLEGTPGEPGVSAYQTWLSLGNTGDEAVFLEALRGATGERGPIGPAGADSTVPGPVGPAGSQGSPGPAGRGIASVGQTSGRLTGTYSDGTAWDAGALPAAEGGTSPARQSASVTTSTLANGASEDVLLPLARSYLLQRLTASHPAWVRLYLAGADRTADGSRPQTQDPDPNGGVVAELIGTVARWPGAPGWDDQPTPDGLIAVRVTNLSGAARALTLTAQFLPLEAQP